MTANHLCAGYKELKEAYEKVVQEKDECRDTVIRLRETVGNLQGMNEQLQQRIDELSDLISKAIAMCDDEKMWSRETIGKSLSFGRKQALKEQSDNQYKQNSKVE